MNSSPFPGIRNNCNGSKYLSAFSLSSPLQPTESDNPPQSAMAETQPFIWVLVSISTPQGSRKRHLIVATTVPNPDY